MSDTDLKATRSSCRILIVDDNPAIHSDFRKILSADDARSGHLDEAEAVLFGGEVRSVPETQFVIDSAFQGQEGLEKVEQAVRSGNPYPLAFVDVRMPPGWDGIETISRLWKVDPALQVVICTAYADYSWDEMRAVLGDSDSALILKKPFDNVEAIQLAHTLTKKWRLARLAEQRMSALEADALAHQRHLNPSRGEGMQSGSQCSNDEEKFRAVFRASPMAMAIRRSTDRCFTQVNEAFLTLTGYAIDEVLRRSVGELGLWDGPGDEVRGVAPRPDGVGESRKCVLRPKRGGELPVSIKIEPLTWDGQPLELMFLQPAGAIPAATCRAA